MNMKNLDILGGGYGGIKVLSGLLGVALPEDLQITLVDKNPYHSYKTEFNTIVAGTAADKDVRIPFLLHDQVQYEYGEVRKIDTENNKIYFQGRSTVVAYDYLVIALGCEDNYHDVEGAKEY